MMRRTVILLAIVVGLSAITFGMGYEFGERHEGIKRNTPDAWESSVHANDPIVRDAVRRWSIKAKVSPDEIMRERWIGWMSFPDRDCVALKLKPGSLGGSPIYCYAVERSQVLPTSQPVMVAEYSDVE